MNVLIMDKLLEKYENAVLFHKCLLHCELFIFVNWGMFKKVPFLNQQNVTKLRLGLVYVPKQKAEYYYSSTCK